VYLNSFGGSGLLHLLAGHPRVVAAFGIVGTVALLVSPLGPGVQGGSARYAEALDRSVSPGISATLIADAQESADAQLSESPEVLDGVVGQTLHLCGPQCGAVTPAIVLKDPVLLRKVLLLHEVNLRATGQHADVVSLNSTIASRK